MNCPRCNGHLAPDTEGDLACMMCGRRPYRIVPEPLPFSNFKPRGRVRDTRGGKPSPLSLAPNPGGAKLTAVSSHHRR